MGCVPRALPLPFTEGSIGIANSAGNKGNDMNRYAELTPAAQSLIDELINAVAAHPGWQESLAFDALKATRKAARKIVEVTS